MIVVSLTVEACKTTITMGMSTGMHGMTKMLINQAPQIVQMKRGRQRMKKKEMLQLLPKTKMEMVHSATRERG